jgi:hypothetical protein
VEAVDERELVRALELALESGRFGRLIWDGGEAHLFDYVGSYSRPERAFGCLAAEGGQLHFVAPNGDELVEGRMKWQNSRRGSFLDWRPRGVWANCGNLRYWRVWRLANEKLTSSAQTLIAPVAAQWTRGEAIQFQCLTRALCGLMWHHFPNPKQRPLRISLGSAYSLRPMQFMVEWHNGHYDLTSAHRSMGFPFVLRDRLRFVCNNFEFIGQQVDERDGLGVFSFVLEWNATELTTAHEQIEAHLLFANGFLPNFRPNTSKVGLTSLE